MASKFQSSLGDDTANRRNKAVAIEFSVADAGCPMYVVCNANETRKQPLGLSNISWLTVHVSQPCGNTGSTVSLRVSGGVRER